MKGWKDSPFTHLALQKAGGSSFQFVPRQCAADNYVERGSQACKTKMCAKCCRKNPSSCSTHAPKKKAKVAASSPLSAPLPNLAETNCIILVLDLTLKSDGDGFETAVGMHANSEFRTGARTIFRGSIIEHQKWTTFKLRK